MLTLLNINVYVYHYCLRINPRKQIHKSNGINILNYIAKFISPQIIPVYFPSRGKRMRISITLNSLSEVLIFFFFWSIGEGVFHYISLQSLIKNLF